MIPTQTILQLILAVLAAFGLSYIQYFYKAKTKRNYVFVLAFFRFISLFLVLVLLINPVFKWKSWYTEKVILPVLIDNSQSIPYIDSTFTQTNWISYFSNHSKLNDKYQVVIYPFAKHLQEAESLLNYQGNATNIAEAATALKNIYRHTFQPILLITDGNQTQGPDYVYAFNPNAKVYPVIVGDTTFVYDIQLLQANANKYVYIKNQFPIEVLAHVATTQPTAVTIEVTEGEHKIVFKKQYLLDANKNVLNETIYLTAQSVGLKKYTIRLLSDLPEKNIKNNTKVLAVDVIDQKSEIAIISSIIHPDLGVLKRSIEKNEHRKVVILKPEELKNINLYDLVILYQPDSSFESVWKLVEQTQKNYWMINGLSSNYAWLNQKQNDFVFKLYNQKEQYAGEKQNDFLLFEVPNLPFNNLPYLDFPFGIFESQVKNTSLLHLKTRGIKTNMPLLTFTETSKQKKAYWFGENLWKWRIETNSDNIYFDQLIDKIVQFLALKTQKQNLVIQLENLYNQTDEIAIIARFFNANLEYDKQVNLEAKLIHIESKTSKNYLFSKRTNESVLNLLGLEPGNYQLIVTEPKTKTQQIKNFEVLAFNAEHQTKQANIKQLKLLAHQSKGQYFLVENIDAVIEQLIQHPDYIPVEKEQITQQKLLDWRWTLVVLLLFLAAEWLLRKYNGLQ